MTLKSPSSSADPAHMLGTSVSSGVWLGTGLIAAITVLSCLWFICHRLRYEGELIRVVAGVKKLRQKLAQQLDEAGAQAADQPSWMQRDPEMVESSPSTPDEDTLDDADAPADAQESSETQVEPEVVAPDSAVAA